MRPVLQILNFCIFIATTGCVTLYKPNAVHSPLLKEKGELNTSASLGMSGCGLLNLQADYAISDHTGVMIDGMYHTRKSGSNDSSVEKFNIFSGEAGAGYFTTLGNKKRGLFQCYGGGGVGKTSDIIKNTGQVSPEVNARYFVMFIQPGLAHTGENFDVAFDLRANYVHLYDIHAYLYDEFEWWNTDLQYYSDTTLNFMNLEPTVTIQAGSEKLKGFLQLGLTIPAINAQTYFDINTASMLMAPLIKFSVGIRYTFGKKDF